MVDFLTNGYTLHPQAVAYMTATNGTAIYSNVRLVVLDDSPDHELCFLGAWFMVYRQTSFKPAFFTDHAGL